MGVFKFHVGYIVTVKGTHGARFKITEKLNTTGENGKHFWVVHSLDDELYYSIVHESQMLRVR